jgi:hypothetical protein
MDPVEVAQPLASDVPIRPIGVVADVDEKV